MIFSIDIFILSISSLIVLLIVYSSFREHEVRAAVILFLGFIFNLVIWLIFLWFRDLIWVRCVNWVTIGLIVFFILISIIRFFPHRPERSIKKITQFDERDHMFSRNNLKFHENLFRKYYRLHPERKGIDKRIHQKPDLGDPSQVFYDPLGSPIFDAAFCFLGKMKLFSRGKGIGKPNRGNPEEITRIIKDMAVQYGAVDAGITRLQLYHLYSHAGTHSENWGKPLKSKHRFAIVVVVAMDEKMIVHAPALPVILESSHQYVESAKIAFIIAEYLRLLGYDATAHTDGNYETLCVPLAIDSGMGELGRMGLLIHHRYGPCIRLSVVTTDCELVSTIGRNFGVDSFCRICKKCSRNCPTAAICDGEEPISRGIFHWSIQQEKCFAFWKNSGTDCGICIRVCPYTKPDSLFHRLVRFYVSRNPLNQRIAYFFDDLLYGKQISIANKNPEKLFFRSP